MRYDKDDYSQEMPDYYSMDNPADDSKETGECARGTNMRPRGTNSRGKLSREGERRKKAKWRSKNKGRYRDYMRHYMRARRAAAGD